MCHVLYFKLDISLKKLENKSKNFLIILQICDEVSTKVLVEMM